MTGGLKMGGQCSRTVSPPPPPGGWRQDQQHWDGGSDGFFKSIWYDWPQPSSSWSLRKSVWESTDLSSHGCVTVEQSPMQFWRQTFFIPPLLANFCKTFWTPLNKSKTVWPPPPCTCMKISFFAQHHNSYNIGNT